MDGAEEQGARSENLELRRGQRWRGRSDRLLGKILAEEGVRETTQGEGKPDDPGGTQTEGHEACAKETKNREEENQGCPGRRMLRMTVWINRARRSRRTEEDGGGPLGRPLIAPFQQSGGSRRQIAVGRGVSGRSGSGVSKR